MARPTLTWERRDPNSDVLVVTNMWPDEERPVYGIFVKRQVDSLIRAGVNCDVLYVRGYRSPLVYLRAAFWFALSSIRLRRRYRLIHAHAGETGIVARFHLGTSVLVSYCGDDLLGQIDENGVLTWSTKLRLFLVRQHSRLFSATITKSQEMEQVLPTSSRRRNVVIPNGVDTNIFQTIPRQSAREAVGWGPDEQVALFAATKPRIPGKRLWLAEAACAQAEDEIGRPVRLEVAEDVSPDQMPHLMNAADCLLMTSSIEGSPNTVKEALMCNLPVVATPAGDIDELLRGVEPSYLCQPDASVLGQAIATTLLAKVRSNGRLVAARLGDGSIAGRILDLYRSIAGVEPRSGSAASAPPVPDSRLPSR